MLTRIASGGQTGTDEGALIAAKACGLETGGYMTKGFETTAGAKPHFAARYGMTEMATASYPARTAANVRQNSLTILLGYDLDSPGSKATRRAATEAGKTVLSMPLSLTLLTTRTPDQFMADEHTQTCACVVAHWLLTRPEVAGPEPRSVNFAGNRAPWLTPYVAAFLTEVFINVLAGIRFNEDENNFMTRLTGAVFVAIKSCRVEDVGNALEKPSIDVLVE